LASLIQLNQGISTDRRRQSNRWQTKQAHRQNQQHYDNLF
jgi:hypothetical protein